MLIRPLNSNDTLSIIEIWKECFTNEVSYIHMFLEKCFPFSVSFGLFDSINSNALAMLSLLPSHAYATIKGNPTLVPGAYIYGVGTLKAHRGKGYSYDLMKMALEYATNTNLKYLVLKPAQDSLYNLYKNQSFETTLHSLQKVYEINPLNPQERTISLPHIKPITSQQYFDIREKTLLDTHILWSGDILGYSLAEVESRDGSYGIIENNGYTIIFALYPIDEHTLKIVDHNAKDITNLNALVNSIAFTYSSYSRIIIETSTNNNNDPNTDDWQIQKNSMIKFLTSEKEIQTNLSKKIISLAME